ncbi:uncharacterized protein LOC143266186 [Megachile rotundata]|uniref:uncharacterized protein LOC143266186 n=1 Tax=Megachile rotundata TaxID=143995 RepID=UPI003FD2BC13
MENELEAQEGSLGIQSESTTLPVPQISIRDAADIVPAFDGHNIPLYQFTKNCLNAKSIISPHAEYGLVQLIKNKLFGQASRVISSGDYNTIDELINVLKSRFAPLYTSYQLYGDLSKIAQMPNEAVVDYSSRVSSLLLQIKNCNEIEQPQLAPQYNKTAETNAVRAFLTGLRSEIYGRLRSHEYIFLDDAISATILAEAEFRENQVRLKMAEDYSRASSYRRPNYIPGSQQTARIQWQQKFCQHCQRLGHRTQDCRNVNQPRRPWTETNQGQPGPQHAAPSPNSQIASQSILRRPPVAKPPPPTCSFCKNIGHTIEQCRKKAYQDKKTEQGTSK